MATAPLPQNATPDNDLGSALADSASRLLATGGDDATLYAAMAEAGWLAVAIAEEQGGLGLGLAQLAALARAIGEARSTVPVMAVAGIALPLLAAAQGKLAEDLLAAALVGEAVPVLAHQAEAAGHARGHGLARLVPAEGGLRLVGRWVAVEAAGFACHLLVPARRPDGATVIVVLAVADAGVERRTYRAIDGRLLMDVAIDAAVAGDQCLTLPDPDAALDAALDRGALLAMAEAVGSMRVLLADTLAYLKTRRQFGQPIGRFQALQHRAVDLTIALEEAEAVVDAACEAEGTADFGRAVAVAKVVGCRSARLIAREAVQMHGGIGITEELRVSHHFRSLTAAESRYGDDDAYRARFAALTASDLPPAKEHRA